MKLRRVIAVTLLISTISLVGCGVKDKEDIDTQDTADEIQDTADDIQDNEIDTGDFDLSSDIFVQSDRTPVDIGDYKPKTLFKPTGNDNNPLITNIFCADPTAVEYNGRLYVFGTNDNQQYLEKPDGGNTYERIKSFVIISTDDMVNWRYEGLIDTKAAAPWIMASWAPSVTSRVEDDGLTHFYLYFSNSGAGVGVLTATDPAGPWTDPLGGPLIWAGMDGLEGCPNPFDPGVCIDDDGIDDDGVGWLAFGGGRGENGTDLMPGCARVCRLGSDMISIDSDFVEVKTPYFFEASELNYINGTYVYTYNSSWDNRGDWDLSTGKAPAQCSMCYMTSKSPLDTDSWSYQGYYLRNPGDLGLEYSNNHSHLQKYNGVYYLFYHTMILDKRLGTNGGFRSLFVSEVEVDEENAIIAECKANVDGVDQIKYIDPYSVIKAETVYLTDCGYAEDDGSIDVVCTEHGVIGIKGVDFSEGCRAVAATVKGSGSIEIRLDKYNSEPSAVLSFDCEDWTNIYDAINVEGVHDVFLVLSGDFLFDEYQFIR